MKIRNTSILSFELILSVLSLGYSLYVFQFSKEPHKDAVGLYVSVIFGLGLLVKIVLSNIFPEIILDQEGIKIFGRKKVKWKEIKEIQSNLSSNKTVVKIEKLNSKRIKEDFKELNIEPEKLDEILNSYLAKYGSVYHTKINQ